MANLRSGVCGINMIVFRHSSTASSLRWIKASEHFMEKTEFFDYFLCIHIQKKKKRKEKRSFP